MPSGTYSCDKCDFNQTDRTFWGSYQYQLDDGYQIDIPRQSAWCNHCNQLTWVDEACLPRLKQKFNDLTKKKIFGENGLWRYLFIFLPSVRLSLKDHLKKINDLKLSFAISEARNHQGRCLKCGGVDYSLYKAGMNHGQCVNNAENSYKMLHYEAPDFWDGPRWSVILKKRLYKTDGSMISETEINRYS